MWLTQIDIDGGWVQPRKGVQTWKTCPDLWDEACLDYMSEETVIDTHSHTHIGGDAAGFYSERLTA